MELKTTVFLQNWINLWEPFFESSERVAQTDSINDTAPLTAFLQTIKHAVSKKVPTLPKQKSCTSNARQKTLHELQKAHEVLAKGSRRLTAFFATKPPANNLTEKRPR